MNRHKDKGNSILNRQKDYQRKDKIMLGNGKFALKMLCQFANRIIDLYINVCRQTFWRKKTKSK